MSPVLAQRSGSWEDHVWPLSSQPYQRQLPSAVGLLLASAGLAIRFFPVPPFHPAASIKSLSSGPPLMNSDKQQTAVVLAVPLVFVTKKNHTYSCHMQPGLRVTVSDLGTWGQSLTGQGHNIK